MKWFNKILKRSEPAAPAPPVTVYVNGSRQTMNVTAYNAMKLSAVYRCTSVVSGTIASIPLRLLRKSDGVFQPFDSTLARCLESKPSWHFNSYTFKEQIVCKVLNQGNAYVLPIFDSGDVVSLVLLSNNSCVYDSNRHIYTVNDYVNKIYGEFKHNDIIHIRNQSLDGYTGISTIRYASRILGIAQSADEQSLETFEGGSMVKGMVTGGEKAVGFGKLQDNQLKSVGDRIDAELKSGKNIISLPDGVEFKSLQMTVAEAKLIEHREFSVYDICRFYGVDPDKVFVGKSGNYKASESSQINFLNNTLNPLMTQIESAFNSVLIPSALRSKYRIQFDRNALFTTDLKSKATYYKTMLELGAYTVNEIRAVEGMPPVDGGDEPFISTNLQTLKNPKVNGNKNDNQSE